MVNTRRERYSNMATTARRTSSVDSEEENVVETQQRTAVQPPTFSGRTDEDVMSFIRNFDRVARANGWNDNTKLGQLPCYLKDAALSWYETMEDAITTYAEIIRNLKDTFKLAAQDEQLFYQLATRRQEEKEDTWNYVHEILRMCHHVNQDMDDAEKVRFILRGLLPDILKQVSLMDNSSVRKLRDNIRQIEAAKVLVEQREASTSRGAVRRSSVDEIEQLKCRLQQLESKGRNFSNYYPHNKFLSSNKPNHKQPRNQNSRRSDGRPICFKCGKPGHYARSCWTGNAKEQR